MRRVTLSELASQMRDRISHFYFGTPWRKVAREEERIRLDVVKETCDIHAENQPDRQKCGQS